jgi:hypothetical protein
MLVACNLYYDDSPMTVAQLFTYIRHRYGDLRAYYLKDSDLVAIPLADETEEVAASLRELAARKGLTCCEVSSAWPELVGPELSSLDGAAGFLVISGDGGKYLQLR